MHPLLSTAASPISLPYFAGLTMQGALFIIAVKHIENILGDHKARCYNPSRSFYHSCVATCANALLKLVRSTLDHLRAESEGRILRSQLPKCKVATNLVMPSSWRIKRYFDYARTFSNR